MSTAKYVKEIMVIDPDSGGEVEIAVYKHEGGGMFAIDSSFIDQVLDDDEPFITDPFTHTTFVREKQRLFLTD